MGYLRSFFSKRSILAPRIGMGGGGENKKPAPTYDQTREDVQRFRDIIRKAKRISRKEVLALFYKPHIHDNYGPIIAQRALEPVFLGDGKFGPVVILRHNGTYEWIGPDGPLPE